MHIAFLIANNSYSPYFYWFAEESKKHADLKFSFIALNGDRPRMLDDMKEINCDCYWIPFDSKNRSAAILSVIPKLYRLFKKIKPDIVHSHLFDDSVPSLIAARLAGIKIRIITKQDTAFHWYYAPQGVKFDRLNNFNATHIIAVSEECKKFIEEKEKANKSKIVLIHHGIPIDKLSNQSKAKQQELIDKFNLQDKFVIGTVARLIEWKGYKYIIEAAEVITKKHNNVRFLFVGEGDQKDELQKLINKKGLNEFIIFTGWLPEDYIPSLFGIMDIYLHAASFEPFGFVIAEAMINSVPIVSTETGAAMDAIEHTKSGYLTPYKDSLALADGVSFMLEHDRKKIGKSGEIKAKQMYSFENMWQKYIDLYYKSFNDK